MPNNSDNVLKFDRPGVFVPAFTRAVFEKGASIQKYRLRDFDDTNILSTASFRYDPPGAGMKSTQQLRVDWSDFSNHIYFNSAEVATNVAFDNIINGYPFDGNRKELEAFFDGLTGFEKWVYDQFPKNKGYLNFSGALGPAAGSYIEVVDHAGAQFPTLSKIQTGRSALDPGRNSVTIEMQLFVPSGSNDNQVIVQKLSGTNQGFTLGLVATGSNDLANVMLSFASASTVLSVTGTIQKGGFTHLAAQYDRSSAENRLYLYADQALIATSPLQAEMGLIDFTPSPLYIGSGSSMTTTTGTFVPAATLSGAIDELRVWHTARTVDQLKRYAKKTVYPDDSLKLYFKFNEPSGSLASTADDSTNRIVLDSSGQSLHAFVKAEGYSGELRNTSSLANPMTQERLSTSPVLFPAFSGVVELNEALLASASDYDNDNPNLITKLVPKHYFLEGQQFEALEDEDGTVGDPYSGDGIPGEGELGTAQLLSALLYTVAKHFDEVKLFIDAFGKTLFVDYDEFDVAPDQLLPFVANYYGFELPGMFSNATFEQFINAEDLDRNPSSGDVSLQQVQNEIWRRILTNLTEIVRSKGTIHSIKAFIRTLGIDPDQNFRIREYGGPKRGKLGASRENKAQVSTMLDVTGSETSFSIVSPYLNGVRTEPGWPLVSGGDDGLFTSGSWTVEGTYRFPITRANAATQSLARLAVTGSALTGEGVIVNVLALSSSIPASASLVMHAKPGFTGAANLLVLPLTGVNIYDGEQWHVSFGRNRNDEPAAELESNVSSSYFLRAIRQSNGVIYEEHVTSSLFLEVDSADHSVNTLQTLTGMYNASGTFLRYGAQTIDSSAEFVTSSEGITTSLNGRLGHIRFWTKGLTLEETREHALNFRSLGVEDPLTNFNFVTVESGSFERLRIDASTDQMVTQSDAFGNINIFDFSQNGLHLTGSGFAITSSIILPETFRYSIISPKFDEAITNNKIRIRSFQEFSNVQRFGGQIAPIFETPPDEEPEDDPRFAIDVSIVDALNEDIINIFATLDSLDNAIGDPELIFAEDYPSLQELRDVYFNRLTDKVNLKAFFEFFKWFDTSVGVFIEQLIPRKTRYLGTNFVVESHMLERPKFQYQYEDVYIGENNRHGLKGTLLLRLITGQIKRY